MALELRSLERSDAEAFTRCVYAAFGAVPGPDNLDRAVEQFEPDFAVAIVDHGPMVATAGAYPLEVTLPAGPGESPPIIAVPGITAVGVIPTYRRRGILTQMMTHQLGNFRERGYTLAILRAPESNIYGRFGFAPAAQLQSLAIERSRSAFRPEAELLANRGRIRMLDPDEAAKVLPLVHDQWRRHRPGELNRRAMWWKWHLKDPADERNGGDARFYALHETADGVADGWVSYRFHDHWSDGLPRYQVDVNDLVATDRAARAALWRLVLDLDLVDEVKAGRQPLDESLRWLLADPRRLRTTAQGDELWLRVLDIPAALEARGYGLAERLVVEVTSADPGSGGRFVLEAGPSSGTCRPARPGEKSQLILGLADLGAIYLGGVTPSVLAAAGRVTEAHPGTLAVADRVFASPMAPFCTLDF